VGSESEQSERGLSLLFSFFDLRGSMNVRTHVVDARRTPTQGLIRSEPSPRDRRRPTEGVPALVVIYNRAGGRAGRFSIHVPTSHDIYIYIYIYIYITRRGRRSTWPLGGKMRSMDASGPTVQVQRRWMITFVSGGTNSARMLTC
jgi:hypothetical protein